MHVLTVVTGALTTALLKLPLMTAIFALVLGNLVGGLAFTGTTLYATHVRTAPKRIVD